MHGRDVNIQLLPQVCEKVACALEIDRWFSKGSAVSSGIDPIAFRIRIVMTISNKTHQTR